MGDVALTVPVIQSFLAQHPSARITIITRSRFAGLFQGEKNLKVFPVDFTKQFSGPIGLWRLAGEIQKLKPDAVIDLHDNLRTNVIRLFLKLAGLRVIVFKKGRSEKRLATGPSRAQHRAPLPHTTKRYAEAFSEAGFPTEVDSKFIQPKFLSTSAAADHEIKIGIAPFAAHATKRWPIQYFEQTTSALSKISGVKIYLFGGGAEETAVLKQWSDRYQNCFNVAGNYTLEEELDLIKSLRLMICTDSSNMHLASISGIPVVSIWGGTHTVTGFGPLPVQGNTIVEVPTDELPCRPCSVYGKAHCERGDFACLTRISPDRVIAEVRKLIQ